MKKQLLIALLIISTLGLVGCGAYSFTGGNVGNAKTIQVDFFANQAALVEPQLSPLFTQELQDLFLRQTSLSLVPSGGDLHFEGEITGYRVNPMSATSQQTAAQNRLTVNINVRFFNKLKPEDDFEKQFAFYADFAASEQLTGSVLDSALDIIIDRITQDIFNSSVGKW